MTESDTPGTSVSTISPELQVIDGQVTTTSVQVAEHFGKRHDTVLRAIKNLGCPKDFTDRNFAVSEYTDSTGRTLPCYRITRQGFTLLAMGFTGKEAMQWKISYLETFDRMEAALTSGTSDRISPAQAQHLRELVLLVVESGKQGHAETWSRLCRKFKVNKYELLHPSQFDAACEYLKGKMDDQSIAALVQKHYPDALKPPVSEPLTLPQPAGLTDEQCTTAVRTGGMVALAVQMAVARAVLDGGDQWRHQRWVVSFPDKDQKTPLPVVEILPTDAQLTAFAQLREATRIAIVIAQENLDQLDAAQRKTLGA